MARTSEGKTLEDPIQLWTEEELNKVASRLSEIPVDNLDHWEYLLKKSTRLGGYPIGYGLSYHAVDYILNHRKIFVQPFKETAKLSLDVERGKLVEYPIILNLYPDNSKEAENLAAEVRYILKFSNSTLVSGYFISDEVGDVYRSGLIGQRGRFDILLPNDPKLLVPTTLSAEIKWPRRSAKK